MDIEIFKQISVGIMIGIPIGMFIMYKILDKKKDKLEKHQTFVGYISLLWISFHIYSFFITGTQLDPIFNVVGGIAVGDFIGIKLIGPVIEKLVSGLKK